MIICVTGVPGTGKTTVSKLIAKEYDLKYIDVNKLIKEEKLYDEYDKKEKEYVVDERKLSKFLVEVIKIEKRLVIDSHLSHYINKKYVDLVIVTKCELKELDKRLKKRRYNKEKIRDNLDSEIFNVCFNEAKERGHKIFVVDTTKGIKKEDIKKLFSKADKSL